MADQSAPDRIVATVALDLIPWVRQMSQEMDLNPNAFINAALSSLREAVESTDKGSSVRIVDLCHRARARTQGLEGNAVTRTLTSLITKIHPDLPDVEEHHRTRYLSRVSQLINERGEVPSADELRRIQAEVGDESVTYARELRDQRQRAKRQRNTG